MTTVHDHFAAALATTEPLASLRALAQRLVDQGEPPETLYGALQSFALELREAGRDPDEDVVFDMLDILAGWCGPSARIVVAGGTE